MATAAAAALLDELMGRCRNAGPDEAVKEARWYDDDVCKFFLVKFCPNDLFVNTKADLGPCSRLHDEALKKKFEEEKGTRPGLVRAFEDEFLKFSQNMITEVEKKIRKGKERLALAQSKSNEADKKLLASGSGDMKSKEEKLIVLAEKIEALCNQAEEAGTRGDVDEAQRLTAMADDLKVEKESLLRSSLDSTSASPWIQAAEMAPQEKLMEVCEICGSFLIVGDAQSRIDDHLLGKQHMGYARLRVAVEEVVISKRKADEERGERDRRGRHDDRDRRRDDRGRSGRRDDFRGRGNHNRDRGGRRSDDRRDWRGKSKEDCPDRDVRGKSKEDRPDRDVRGKSKEDRPSRDVRGKSRDDRADRDVKDDRSRSRSRRKSVDNDSALRSSKSRDRSRERDRNRGVRESDKGPRSRSRDESREGKSKSRDRDRDRDKRRRLEDTRANGRKSEDHQ